jgi:hypothetical protein
MSMGRKTVPFAVFFLLAVFTSVLMPYPALGADENHAAGAKEKVPKDAELTLVQSVMCESVQNLKSVNEALTFSVSLGHVYCVSSFKPVPKPTVIFHRWYRRNELSTQIRLKVYPPHWTTYSVIQLREEDKGPWHIEVTDQNGKIFDVVRFSITD